MNPEYDVIICGYGPVGQTAANLLGQAGLQVLALEQWSGIYHLPRAAHIDHEIMRIIQSIGKAEEIQPSLITCEKYEWLNADGKTLIEFPFSLNGKSGWPSDYLIYQPMFEDILHGGVLRFANVEVRNNARVTAHEEFSDRVTVQIEHTKSGESTSATGRYLLGCDGANSYVRRAAGIEYDDLGFNESWLVIDVKLDPAAILELPQNPQQHCDPRRPVTLCPMPGYHQRWEFMMLPGETREQMTAENYVWSLIQAWGVTADNAKLERAVVYTFNSKLATHWRKGRLLLAGDSCHLTPPFLGQGMSMGMRDAKNVCWKLDLICRGIATDQLLEAYTEERLAQVNGAIQLAVELGNVVCEKDPEKVRERDANMLAVRARGVNPVGEDTITFPDITNGMVRRDQFGNRIAPAGDLFIQARVDDKHKSRVLLDDITGPGFVIIGHGVDPLGLMNTDQRLLWQKLGGSSVSIGGATEADSIAVVEGGDGEVYAHWFAKNNCRVALMRPDFYLFGTATGNGDVSDLLDSLFAQLQLA